MLYNRCTGIYKFGNNTYPRCIRHRLNLGHIFWAKKCVLWAGKYGSRVQGVAWINLVQDRDHWWTVVHVVCEENLDSIKRM